MPQAPVSKGLTKYDGLFQLLTKPGQSVTDVDIAYLGTLQHAARRYGKAHSRQLKVCIVDEKHCGVWWLQDPAATAA